VNRYQGSRLDSGDTFPAMQFKTTTSQSFDIPSDFSGKWSILLFYRGDW